MIPSEFINACAEAAAKLAEKAAAHPDENVRKDFACSAAEIANAAARVARSTAEAYHPEKLKAGLGG